MLECLLWRVINMIKVMLYRILDYSYPFLLSLVQVIEEYFLFTLVFFFFSFYSVAEVLSGFAWTLQRQKGLKITYEIHKVVRTAKELFGISPAGWIAEELEYVHSVTGNEKAWSYLMFHWHFKISGLFFSFFYLFI